MRLNYKEYIDQLNLEPHPEGGYFKETYRSSTHLENLNNFEGPRNCSTAIYFLLTNDSKSHLHRIKSDEMWHFYAGDPLKVVMLNQNGEYRETIIGPDLKRGQVFQFLVPKGCWFGAEVLEGGTFSLVGCTVSPGFDFSDFELADRKTLSQSFPQHQSFIEEFCLKT